MFADEQSFKELAHGISHFGFAVKRYGDLAANAAAAADPQYSQKTLWILSEELPRLGKAIQIMGRALTSQISDEERQWLQAESRHLTNPNSS